MRLFQKKFLLLFLRIKLSILFFISSLMYNKYILGTTDFMIFSSMFNSIQHFNQIRVLLKIILSYILYQPNNTKADIVIIKATKRDIDENIYVSLSELNLANFNLNKNEGSSKVGRKKKIKRELNMSSQYDAM